MEGCLELARLLRPGRDSTLNLRLLGLLCLGLLLFLYLLCPDETTTLTLGLLGLLCLGLLCLGLLRLGLLCLGLFVPRRDNNPNYRLVRIVVSTRVKSQKHVCRAGWNVKTSERNDMVAVSSNGDRAVMLLSERTQ